VKTLKIGLVLFLSLGFAGCAGLQEGQLSSKYEATYINALNERTNLTVTKEGNLEEIRDKVRKHLESLGYNKVVYAAPELGFIVVAKNISIASALFIGNDKPYQIIYKLTKAEDGKIIIELVKGTNILTTNTEVNKDMEKIYKQIESD